MQKSSLSTISPLFNSSSTESDLFVIAKESSSLGGSPRASFSIQGEKEQSAKLQMASDRFNLLSCASAAIVMFSQHTGRAHAFSNNLCKWGPDGQVCVSLKNICVALYSNSSNIWGWLLSRLVSNFLIKAVE